MNYFEDHIGDYAAATAHLSWDEDMAYTRLIRAYYHHEKPIPADLKQACRLARAATPNQRAAVETVLREFFTLRDDGWHQKRCDAEIARFQDKQDKARRSANARWKQAEAQTEGNANASQDAMRTHTEGNAPRHQTPDTRPIEIQEEPTALVNPAPSEPARHVACPTEEIVALYHEHCPALPRVTVLNDPRRKAISTRWREVVTDPDIRKAEDPRAAALDWWAWFFGHVSASPFLTGRTQGPRQWHATLDWLMAPTNFAKVVDGNYHKEHA